MRNTFTLFLICTLAFSFELAAQFTSVSDLNPLKTAAFATREKPQAKVLLLDGKYWAVLANTTGTHLWRLENNDWKHELELSTKNSLADYVMIENKVHILLYSGSQSQFVSLEYDKSQKKFMAWKQNKSTVKIDLEEKVEVASITADNAGTLWIASSGGDGNVNVRWSTAPYTEWSSPLTIAQGLNPDDICAVISLPKTNQIGVMWSNQKTKRWGFKTHTLGDESTKWSKDEVPASQSALSQGTGMSDDHINMKVASDGTLYVAIKTGYNAIGYPLISLLVRRPSGVWDDLYEVSQTGTLPIVILNEEQNLLKVVYTSATYGGDILYKETSLSNISFCTPHVLLKGKYNYATSTKDGYSSETVILASNETHVVGVVATDNLDLRSPLVADCDNGEIEPSFNAYPNPFLNETIINFRLPKDQNYSLTLYNSNGGKVSQLHSSTAVASKLYSFTLDASKLARGLYILKLETSDKVEAIKLIHER
ncbi:T9SS type A sorting domain-containing protein [Pontibacter sp. FD36]|uniref:T9SS type A sorting domain-containing protein n=1 Tax=Pontibacter sp. FD36 TaxID=2789860 RepID=UPI0018AB3A3F|nr:T9SS type A sorting domain-containing protein [Pontibacter sp. FD36]MBF8965721.1 T9SS type A sorting domain-containing protein [Pontibacter sp. FD36]